MKTKTDNKLSQDDFKALINNYGGATGQNNRPLDQFEGLIVKGLNSGKSFSKNTAYDLKNVGKGFKNGSIELIRDTSRSKIFVSSFHVNRDDGTNKVTNVTIYFFEYKKDNDTKVSEWRFTAKVKITNSSKHNYPLEKLHRYIEKQLQLDGKHIESKYSKVVEGSSADEIEAYGSLIEQVKELKDRKKVTQVLKQIFESNKTADLTKYLLENNLLDDDLKDIVEYRSRVTSIEDFVDMLENTHTENDWQTWFQENSWVLGSDFVRILDERRIDVQNISDYLVEAYDGFLDVIEIKKPSSDLKFWPDSKDHDNYYPHSDLTKAITQSINYINQIEKQIDSKEFSKRIDDVTVIKPRCTLIFGRSIDWDDEQKEAYRILNSSYHNVTILTYDHVLERAKRMLGGKHEWTVTEAMDNSESDLDSDDLLF